MNKDTVVKSLKEKQIQYDSIREKCAGVLSSDELSVLNSVLDKAACVDFMLIDPASREVSDRSEFRSTIITSCNMADYYAPEPICEEVDIFQNIEQEKYLFLNSDKIDRKIYAVSQPGLFKDIKSVLNECLRNKATIPDSLEAFKVSKFESGFFNVKVTLVDDIVIHIS